MTLALSLVVAALSIAFGLLYDKYHRTKRDKYRYAALFVMMLRTQVMKERDRERRHLSN